MISDLEFSVANYSDIDGIMAIEEKYFSGENRTDKKNIAYKREDIIKWMYHNPEMVYVVRDENNQVKGFTIIVPITKAGYDKFKAGLVKDLDKLDLSDIMQNMESEYYYFADVACDNKNKIASMVLFKNVLPMLMKTTYIVTIPMTKAGRIKAKSLCAKNASGEDNLELEQPCYIHVPDAMEAAQSMIDTVTELLNRRKGR